MLKQSSYVVYIVMRGIGGGAITGTPGRIIINVVSIKVMIIAPKRQVYSICYRLERVQRQ